MRIGIVCEGPSDAAVITNILKGVTGLDTSNFVPIVPILDNTSKGRNPDAFSSWSVVIKECREKKKIDQFMGQIDSTHLVVHLDTAEAAHYGIIIPDSKDEDFCSKLRTEVVNMISGILGDAYSKMTLYAVAIQEIDAWILTIYDKNTCLIRDAKKHFQRLLGKQGIRYRPGYSEYLTFSYDFRNSSKTKKNGYLNNNCSLRWFWEEAEQKLL